MLAKNLQIDYFYKVVDGCFVVGCFLVEFCCCFLRCCFLTHCGLHVANKNKVHSACMHVCATDCTKH